MRYRVCIIDYPTTSRVMGQRSIVNGQCIGHTLKRSITTGKKSFEIDDDDDASLMSDLLNN